MQITFACYVADLFGGIAQLVERLVRNEKVRGSNPLTSTNFSGARWAETRDCIVAAWSIHHGETAPRPSIVRRCGEITNQLKI